MKKIIAASKLSFSPGMTIPVGNAVYTIVKELGAGTFATVYLCTPHTTDSKVAIKVISKKHSREALNEHGCLQILGEHPNIVPFIAASKDSLFLVLGHFELTLSAKLKQPPFEDGMPTEMIHVISRSILKGLEYLSRKKVVHADIKPMNILLDPSNSSRICDFGSSVREGSVWDWNRTSHWFAAPETINPRIPRKYTSKLDIFSFASILFKTKTGHYPFVPKVDTDASQLETIQSKLSIDEANPNGNLTKLEQKYPKITENPNILRVLSLALVINPLDRASAEDLLAQAFYCAQPDPPKANE